MTSLESPIQVDTINRSISNNGSSNSESILLKVQYLWYVNSEGITHFYAGLGPRVEYGRIHSDQQYINSTSLMSSIAWNTETRTGTLNSWSVGVGAAAGIEYFPARLISLHAEYNVYLIYHYLKNTSKTHSLNSSGIPNSNNYKSSGITRQWLFGNGDVNFGLSIYF